MSAPARTPAPVAGEHDRPGSRGAVERLERVRDLPDEREAQRVEHLGPRDRDQRDAGATLSGQLDTDVRGRVQVGRRGEGSGRGCRPARRSRGSSGVASSILLAEAARGPEHPRGPAACRVRARSRGGFGRRHASRPRRGPASSEARSSKSMAVMRTRSVSVPRACADALNAGLAEAWRVGDEREVFGRVAAFERREGLVAALGPAVEREERGHAAVPPVRSARCAATASVDR